LLAGRPEEADGIMDRRLDGSDEISLWRAMRQAMLDDGSPAAAAVFAATAPLAFQYPRPIRDHILPLIVETMIKGGEITPAARLLNQRKNDPQLAYARALMQQAEGDTEQALSMLDELANGHDQFDRARAAIRAVELRLTSRKLDKKQAADALDKLLYAWRGDARELALRERIAELRDQTGDRRSALALLRQAETDFPEQAASIRGRLQDTFAGMIHDEGERKAPPIEFVSTVDENADLVAGASDDETVLQSLADRLLALDLPDRAKPVLEKLMRSAKTDVAKARFGTSLAALDSREGDDAGARAMLESSESADLPADLVEKRLILRAGSVARLGDAAAGAALLAPLHTEAAVEARAEILETALNWAAAEQAWSECVALTLPDHGVLDEPQTRMLLRLATATARAGDDPGLADLRGKYGGRIGSNPLADMFRLLTVEPIRTTADIKRSQKEVSLAASLPADLKALRGGAGAR
jgi:tetratricopeptide (TPR) repeat protein